MAQVEAGTMATVTGDLGWTGAPTADGDQTWPASLLISFAENNSGNFDKATVSLDSTAYAGVFQMEDSGMTSQTERLFGDGVAQMALTMEPLADLNEQTIHDVTRVEFTWAHPEFNGPAPISWLTMEGPLNVAVPEPGRLLTYGATLVIMMVLLAVRQP